LENDFAAKLQSVLSNPEALAKISAIASSFGGTLQPEEPAEAPRDIPKKELPLALPTDPRLALLSSVKPLLREEKRGKVDSLLTALTVASMLKNFRK